MKQESSPLSWVLRTHFSRAVCYRLATCVTKPLLDLPWKSVGPSAPKTPLRLGDPDETTVFIAPAPSLDVYCLQDCLNTSKPVAAESTDVDFSFSMDAYYPEESFAPTKLPTKTTDSTETDDFSCSFSGLSSTSSHQADASSLHPKSMLQYSTSEAYMDTLSEEEEPRTTDTCCSSHGILSAVLKSLPIISVRRSLSTDSFLNQQDQSDNDASKGSLCGRASFKRLQKSSPPWSPVGSPTGSSTYSNSSSGSVNHQYECTTYQDSIAPSKRPNMPRVLSWSDHLSNSSGNERAVLSAEKWMIDLSQLLLGERFASGNHCRVYHGLYRENPVAVKVIRQPDEDETMADRLEKDFTREVTMLSCLEHQNIVKFIAACKKPPVLCIITEYLPGGSMRCFLRKREGKLLPIREVLRMALDVTYGMEYLHMKGIMHRDLKSDNLAIAADGSVKILDFGVSCFQSDCDYRAEDIGTYRWMAPEMLSQKPYSRKVDVYSFGIVLWELLTAQLPYEHMGAVQAAFSVLHKNLRPHIPSHCPASLKDLMCRCWSPEPKKRPEFWQILQSLHECQKAIPSLATLDNPEMLS